MTIQPHISLQNIRVTYHNGHTALNDASFEISAGSLCALIGINGSGKSTLFKTIMGVIKPTQGTVKINQQSVAKALRNNLVAYVPQTEEVDWNFPVLVNDVVMMGRYGKMSFLRIPSKQDKHHVEQALDRVGMLHLRHRQIGELSGGQRKRVFLARALAQQSKILLLDEPFTGVDVKTENAIISLLKTLRDEGHLLLVSTHNLNAIPTYCNKVIMINQTVIAAGTTETTFTQNNLQHVFGGIIPHLGFPSAIQHSAFDHKTQEPGGQPL